MNADVGIDREVMIPSTTRQLWVHTGLEDKHHARWGSTFIDELLAFRYRARSH